MVCFCRQDAGAIATLLAQLAIPADAGVLALDMLASLKLRQVAALSVRLAAAGLPAPPWAPVAAWADLELPVLPMPPAAMATLACLGQLRAQALATLGLDLSLQAAALPFARLAATLSARIEAALAMSVTADLAAVVDLGGAGARALQSLAGLALALDAVELALAAPLPDPLLYAIDPAFDGMRARLQALLPLIAILLQLGIDPASPDLAAELAVSVRALLAIRLPEFPPAMVQLSATLGAVASLRASLGVDPLRLGIGAVAARLSVRAAALLEADLRALAQVLVGLPACPTLSITADVVAVAVTLDAEAVARLTWTPPPIASLRAIGTGAVAVQLAAGLSATLGLAAAASPCADGCDAARLVRAIA